MKKLIATALAAALIVLSPGLPCYQALAADVEGGPRAADGPQTVAAPKIDNVSTPLSNPGLNTGIPNLQVPGVDAGMTLPGGTPALPSGPASVNPAAPGVVPVSVAMAAANPVTPSASAQTPGLIHPAAAAVKPGEAEAGSGVGNAAASKGAGSGTIETIQKGEVASQLSDTKTEKTGVLNWIFERVRRKGSNAAVEVLGAGQEESLNRALKPAAPVETIKPSVPAPAAQAAPVKKSAWDKAKSILDFSSYNKTQKAFLIGQIVFIVGIAIYMTSMPLLVASLTGSTAFTGTVRLVHYVTLGAASLVSGEVVKRSSMKGTLTKAGRTRAAIYGAIGVLALALGTGLPMPVFLTLVGLNALVVAHNHLVDIDAGGAAKIFPDKAQRQQAFYQFLFVRYGALLVVPWVFGFMADKLDLFFGAGVGAKVGMILLSAALGTAAWLYQKMDLGPAEKDADTFKLRDLPGMIRDTPGRIARTAKAIWSNGKVRIRVIMSMAEQFLEDALFFVVMPTFAIDVLGQKAMGNGLVLSATYLGGLLASKVLMKHAGKFEKLHGEYKLISALSVLGALAFIPSIGLWAFPSIWVALPLVLMMKLMLAPIQAKMQALLQTAIDEDPKAKAEEENIWSLITTPEVVAAGLGGLFFEKLFEHSQPGGLLHTALGANGPMKVVSLALLAFSALYLGSLPFLKKQLAHPAPAAAAVEPGPLNGKSIVVVGSYLPNRAFIFETARRLGVEVILVDDPSRREHALAYVKPENFIAAPVLDADKHDETAAAVERLVAERRAEGKSVDGSLAFLDAYTVLNAKITEKLGLRGHGLDPILNTKSKDKMREVLAAHSDFAVGFRRVATEAEAEAAFRALGHGVLKPPRGAGSQFVAEIRTEAEAREQFRQIRDAQEKMRREDPLKAGRYSVGKSFGGALYEEYLEGPEVDVEIVVQNGVVKLMTVADNLPTEPPYFVETGDTYPSQLPASDQAAIKAMAREAVRVIGLKNGNIHLEAKMTPKGPRVIEVNSRMGGDFVYAAMKQTWGVDLIELGLKAAAGVEIPDLTGIESKGVVAALEWPVPSAGVIESISPQTYEMAANPAKYGLYKLEILKDVGALVEGPPSGLSEKPVNVQALGKTYAEAKKNAEKALARIKMTVRPKDAPPSGATRNVYPGRADLTSQLEAAASAVAARDREKALSALEKAGASAVKAAAASELLQKTHEAAAALAAGQQESARVAVAAALNLAPAAEEALALVKLEANLKRMGLPAFKTAMDASPADDGRPTVAMLSPASVYKISIAREGSRQGPEDFHLALDPSWFFQDRLADGTTQLRLRKGLRFDEHGQATLVSYAQPRLVRFFDNYLTPSGNDRDDGVPLEKGLAIPMSSSHVLENITNDKILTRIMMAQMRVGVPATAAFLMPGYKLDLSRTLGIETPHVTAKPLPQGKNARAGIRARIESFLAAYKGAEVVVKPSGPRFHSARGVRYFARTDVEGMIDHVLALSQDELMTSDGAVLVEQRLTPPAVYLRAKESDGSGRFGFLPDAVPVHFLKAGQIPQAGPKDRKDWNLRVLVARTPWGGAAIQGIFGRAGTWGVPTNGEPPNPADAAAIVKFEDIISALQSQHGLLKTPAEAAEFRTALEKTAADTILALRLRESKEIVENGALPGAMTDYLGLDVMVEVKDGKVVPYVIEINDKDSGGQWQLDEFYPGQRGEHSRERIAFQFQAARRDALRGKRVIVVGAGYSGKRFIFERMRELGVNVVLIDKGLSGPARVLDRILSFIGLKSRDNWARDLVSEFINVDTSRREEALAETKEKLLRSARKNGKIDGIATFWEDDVPFTADVAQALGLPYHSPEGARAARSKAVTRQIMKDKKLPTPRFERVETAAELETAIESVGFPAVLKPAFGASAAFVVRVNNAEEARAAFARVEREMTTEVESALSHGRTLVLEQYLDGPEYDVDIVMQGGKAKFVSVTDNWPTKEPYFLATGSSLPSVLPASQQDEIGELAIKTAEALGLTDGVIHVEGKYTKEGPRIVEANGRMGGVYVRDWVKAVWGVDLVEETLYIAAGIPVGPFKAPQPLAHLEGEFLIPEKSGVLSAFDLPDAANLPGFHELRRMKAVGDDIRVPPDGYDRVGMLVARGGSNAQARQSLQDLRARLILKIGPQEKR